MPLIFVSGGGGGEGDRGRIELTNNKHAIMLPSLEVFECY